MKTLVRALVVAGALTVSTVSVALAADGPPEKTDAFVCPVLGGQAGEHGNADAQPFFQIAGGDYSLIGGEGLSVPVHATNGNGTGSPGGAHSSPGDTDYTAIWATP